MHWHVRDFWTHTSLVLSSSSHHKHHHHKSSTSVSTSSEFTATTTVPWVSSSETPSISSYDSVESTVVTTPSASISKTSSSEVSTPSVSSEKESSKSEACTTCTSTTTMSTILSKVTISSTIFVALSTAIPSSPPDIPSALHGLPSCSQDVLFPLLGSSKCNPADFPCICAELDHLGAHKELGDKCAGEADKYAEFALGICGGAASVVTVPTGVPQSVVSSTAPFNNATSTAAEASKTAPAILPTGPGESGNGTAGGSGSGGSGSGGSGGSGSGSGSGSGGSGSGSGSGGSGSGSGEGSASPSGSSPTQPESPIFSGAAVSEFGNGKMATFAGFMGMMWLAFAEL